MQLAETISAPPTQDAGRHSTDGDWKSSVGQSAEEPEHLSGISQTPAALRHSVEEGRKASAGQLADEPVQASTRSQG
ncbi:MAG TPA: hypothetical protein PK668_27150, partial [Myxococcota bacterium]|nr:hypothetical protein [Myxococcota bacterium]